MGRTAAWPALDAGAANFAVCAGMPFLSRTLVRGESISCIPHFTTGNAFPLKQRAARCSLAFPLSVYVRIIIKTANGLQRLYFGRIRPSAVLTDSKAAIF
jgi:hypothetical protein